MARSEGPGERLETPPEHVARLIVVVRGQRVIMDSDLAVLYGVENKALLQAVRRNKDRFPPDFVFQLDKQEVGRLRSQFVTSNARGDRLSNSGSVRVGCETGFTVNGRNVASRAPKLPGLLSTPAGELFHSAIHRTCPKKHVAAFGWERIIAFIRPSPSLYMAHVLGDIEKRIRALDRRDQRVLRTLLRALEARAGPDADTSSADAVRAEIEMDLAAANDYVARHGSFADLAREHYASADDGAV